MWDDIEGFEGKYQVNEYGVVRGVERTTVGEKICRHTKEHILKPTQIGYGYLGVSLRDGKNTYHRYIHRLVAESFVEKISPSCNFVNHIDGNKTNNYYLNLEWCNCSENNQHAYDNGLKDRGENFYNAKLSEDNVREILSHGKNGTYQEIADQYGVSKATIRDVLMRRTWKHISL